VPRAGWELRDYQKPLWKALIHDGKNVCASWHRRGGKDEVLLNALAVKALQRPASYAYMFPEISHARRAMWQSINPHTGRRRILEAFPPEIMDGEPNETEMRLKVQGGGSILFFGSDQYDRLVGASLAGIVSSEHALSHPSAYAFFSPMLRENGGFFAAISTPRGRNHFHGLMNHAATSDNWFAQRLSIEDTQALTEPEIKEALAEYISLYGIDQGEALFRQEYLCDFNAAIMGAYYAREMVALRNEGRIDATLEHINAPVHRSWDIGVRDDTSIWWFQVVGGQVFVLDCYTANGVGVDHYAEVIEQRAAKYGWSHGVDFVPHDAKVKEWGTGRTRVETMMGYGLNPQVVPQAGLLDGINATRRTLPRCIFHSRCEDEGLAALEQYRREWDDDKKTFKANPLHDWSSHLADSFRYLSLAWRTIPPEPIAAPQVTGWQPALFRPKADKSRIKL
jgi:phage terminase large subunit